MPHAGMVTEKHQQKTLEIYAPLARVFGKIKVRLKI